MKKKSEILLLLLSLLATAYLQAQPACRLRIDGKILLGKDSIAAAHSEIFAEQGRIKTMSDAEGKYVLNGLCAGKITIEIDHKEYGHFHIEIQIASDTQLITILPIHIGLIKETQIIAHTEHEATELTDKKLVNMAGSNLGKILENLNGVSILKSGTSVVKPILNGFSGLRVPIFSNGIKQANQQWGNDHGPDLSALGYDEIKLLQGIEILSKCSDAFGGIIEFNNSKHNVHKGETDIKGGTGYGHNGNQVYVFGRMHQQPYNSNKIWYANAYSSIAGNIETPGHTLSNTSAREIATNIGFTIDGQKFYHKVDFGYFAKENGIYSGTRIGNNADILYRISLDQSYKDVAFSYVISPTYQKVNHLQTSYSITKPINHGERFGRISIQSNNRKEFDFHRRSSVTFPQLDLSLINQTIELGETRKFDKINWQYGLLNNLSVGRYGGYFFIPDYNYLSQSLYSLVSIEGRFTHRFALRSEYHVLQSSTSQTNILDAKRKFPIITGGYEIITVKNNLHFKYSAMLLERIPWVNELYSYGVHHGAAAFEQGQKSLIPEKNISQAVQIELQTNKTYFYSRIYFHYIKDFINLQPDAVPVQTIRGAFPSYTYRQFDAIYSGLDITLDIHVMKNIRWVSKGTFVYGKNMETHTYPAYIPPIKASSILIYVGKMLDSEIEYTYTFRQFQYTSNTDLLPPPPGFGVLNLQFTLKQPRIARRVTFSAGAQNVLNVKYREYTDRFRFYSNSPGINIFFKVVINTHKHKE